MQMLSTGHGRLASILAAALLLAPASVFVHAQDEAPKADAPKVDAPPEQPRRVWQQLRPERLVSEDTFLYVATPDITRLKTAFERTALNGLLNEEEIRTPIMATFAKLREAFVKGDNIRNETEIRRRSDEANLAQKILAMLDGQVALAIDAQSQAGNHAPKFLFIASMPNEDRQRELEALLDKYRFSQTTDPRYRDSNDHIGSYEIYRLENNEIGLTESWSFVENLFVYGQGDKIVDEAVERYAVKNGAGTLSLHPGYQGAYKEVGRDERGESQIYLQMDVRALARNIPALAKLQHADADANAAAALDALRPQIALGLQIGEGGNAPIRERILVRLPRDFMPGKPPEGFRAITARFAQNDALFYSARQFNLADILKSPLLKFVLPLNYLKDLTGAANEAEVLAKLDMFKGECGLFMSYVPQPSLKYDSAQDYFDTFQMVLAVELDRDLNDVAFNNLMTRIEGRTKQTYLTTPLRDIAIHYQKGAAPREEKGPNPLGLSGGLRASVQDPSITPFFLCWSRVDLETEGGGPGRKFLLLSDSLNALRKAVQQSRAPRSSLADDSRFREMQKSLRDSRTDFNYLDLTKLVDIYGSFLPRFGRSGQIPREVLNQMPSANALRPHLFPMAWASSLVNDPEGVEIETYSPTGNLPLATLLGLTAWPLIVDRQSEAVSRQIDRNYKQVMLGLHLYAADFDRFPQQLSDLYPAYIKNLSVFESPFRRAAVTAETIDNPELTNMIYVPGRSLQDLGSDVLVYEKEPTRLTKTSDGSQLYHHVITIDGKKTWLTRPALDLRLAGRVDYVSNMAEKTGKAEKTQQGKPVDLGSDKESWLERLLNPNPKAGGTAPDHAPAPDKPDAAPAPRPQAAPENRGAKQENIPDHLRTKIGPLP